MSLIILYAGRAHSLGTIFFEDQFYPIESLVEEGLPTLQNIFIAVVNSTVHGSPWISGRKLSRARITGRQVRTFHPLPKF